MRVAHGIHRGRACTLRACQCKARAPLYSVDQLTLVSGVCEPRSSGEPWRDALCEVSQSFQRRAGGVQCRRPRRGARRAAAAEGRGTFRPSSS
eukprot:scaffold5766_cov256-Pinguiococcus_pyrenoidosus.AAC.11